MFKLFSLISFALIVSPVWALSTPKLTASIKPVAMLVKAVVGDEIPVNVILARNVSPHDYQLRFSDIKLIKQSDLFFWIGPTLESGLSKAIASHSTMNSVELMQMNNLYWPNHTINTNKKNGHEQHHNGSNEEPTEGLTDILYERDPHIWLNPNNIVAIVNKINTLLGKKYPDHEENFQKNKDYFLLKMKILNKDLENKFIQVKEKGFIVVHDGYRHFMEHYNLKQLGVINLSSDITASAKHKGKLARISAKSTCIFTDPQHSTKSVIQLVDESDIKSKELDLMGNEIALTQDSFIEFFGKFSETVIECLE